ncbi:hypothetical protein K490DRAFT_53455 [Saccharata proteae CBS 121410]|uniref:Uncharacterized protein n=1 Tax=Saccharata proteae CBS 121410 TaxID=1314787 RepID=A0A9P4I2K2_9PEZI|nr:hypothetical protein K490DRAFT_53455 [Saccharata proteae CBS 121410]
MIGGRGGVVRAILSRHRAYAYVREVQYVLSKSHKPADKSDRSPSTPSTRVLLSKSHKPADKSNRSPSTPSTRVSMQQYGRCNKSDPIPSTPSTRSGASIASISSPISPISSPHHLIVIVSG